MPKKRARTQERANPADLTFLQPHEVLAIDRALERLVGDGEIHLIVEERQLSYIQTLIECALIERPKRVTPRLRTPRASADAKRN